MQISVLLPEELELGQGRPHSDYLYPALHLNQRQAVYGTVPPLLLTLCLLLLLPKEEGSNGMSLNGYLRARVVGIERTHPRCC